LGFEIVFFLLEFLLEDIEVSVGDFLVIEGIVVVLFLFFLAFATSRVVLFAGCGGCSVPLLGEVVDVSVGLLDL
jgi:hypothetical protein